MTEPEDIQVDTDEPAQAAFPSQFAYILRYTDLATGKRVGENITEQGATCPQVVFAATRRIRVLLKEGRVSPIEFQIIIDQKNLALELYRERERDIQITKNDNARFEANKLKPVKRYSKKKVPGEVRAPAIKKVKPPKKTAMYWREFAADQRRKEKEEKAALKANALMEKQMVADAIKADLKAKRAAGVGYKYNTREEALAARNAQNKSYQERKKAERAITKPKRPKMSREQILENARVAARARYHRIKSGE